MAKVATAGGNCWVLEVHAKEASVRDLGTYPPYGCHFFAGGAAAASIVKDCAENEEGSAETDERGVAETAPSFLGSAKKEEAAVGVGVAVRVARVAVSVATFATSTRAFIRPCSLLGIATAAAAV
jgi:hypothetical protein